MPMKEARFYIDRSGLRFRLKIDAGDVREEDGACVMDVHVNELLDSLMDSDVPQVLQTIYYDYFRNVMYAPNRDMLLATLGVALHRLIRENVWIFGELLKTLKQRR